MLKNKETDEPFPLGMILHHKDSISINCSGHWDSQTKLHVNH